MTIQAPVAERKVHPFLTHDMIFEIPQAIKDTLQRNKDRTHQIASKLRNKGSFYFTGCGTAFFSAMLGERFLRMMNKVGPVSMVVETSELSSYDFPVDNSCVCLGVSHSGITKSTLDSLRVAKSRGAFCIGITHFVDHLISGLVHETLIAGNSPDASRCHTKCYVDSAIACAQLGMELLTLWNAKPSRAGTIEMDLWKLPEITGRILRSVEDECEKLASGQLKTQRFFIVGTGPNLANAYEGALKMKETSFVAAEGLETEQVLHGPWVSLDRNATMLILAPAGAFYRRSLDLVRAAKTVGASVIGLVDEHDGEISALCDSTIRLPRVDEYLSPFTSIIPIYLFAYYSSIKRGHNPDLLRYVDPTYWKARQIVFPPGTH